MNSAPDFQRLRQKLSTGLTEMQLVLDAAQQEKLLQYIALLTKWNKIYNLTAVRDTELMVSRHLLDSLSTQAYVEGKTLLDIGSGAGLPGIPLAITNPRLQCTLLDSNLKKTRFIQQAITELELENALSVHARVEQLELAPVDIVVSRAFSSPVDIITKAGHLCLPGGCMLFMLGHPDGLLDSLPDSFQLVRLDSVTVPFETGTRHIALCRRRRT